MRITNLHFTTPSEMRFTIVDGDRETVRTIFASQTVHPFVVAEKIADSLNRYFEDKAAGFPFDYNQEAHIAGILSDAACYGCD